MKQINLYEKIKPNLKIKDITIKIQDDSDYIESLNPGDLENQLTFIPWFSIDIFENNQESICYIRTLSNKLGVHNETEKMYNSFYNLLEKSVINSISQYSHIFEYNVETSILPGNKVQFHNKDEIIDILNTACRRKFSQINEMTNLFLQHLQFYFNYVTCYKTTKEFLEFRYTHPNMEIIPNRIYNSPFGSTYIITDIMSDEYKSYEVPISS